VLVTLQHLQTTPLEEICAAVNAELGTCYRALQRADRRWSTRWDEIELLVNPNGPLINGGSDGDNGQTGRKLVVDYYGPRVAIGGGALSGKDLTHIDRAAAYAARQAAVHAATTGAGECRVILAWAPNLSQPLDVVYEMEGRGERWPAERFSHGGSAVRAAHPLVSGAVGCGTHFYDDRLPWNRAEVANYETERAAS
jgi:S-adenosylmethionine synthetase